MGGRDAIAKCGIPKAALRGFRCPYLSDRPEVRQVLFENGFRYDSTIGAHGGNNRQFPATMDKVGGCWLGGYWWVLVGGCWWVGLGGQHSLVFWRHRKHAYALWTAVLQLWSAHLPFLLCTSSAGRALQLQPGGADVLQVGAVPRHVVS